ncbi:MAG: TspO/MBR family protein, partial [Candidatus Binatia bacterium]
MSNENNSSPTSERMRSFLVLLATLGMLAFNWIAAIGYVNGTTPGEISAKYQTIITPADYAFSIWSLIYLGMMIFSIYQLMPSQIERFRPVRSLYIVSCVLNCLWIYFWQSELIAVCMIIIVALWVVLLLIVAKLSGFRGFAGIWLLHAPFGIYFGWVTAATLVNFAVMLVYLGRMPTGNAATVLGSVLLAIGGASAILVRIRFANFFFPLSIAWAATAIAIRNSETMLVVVAALVVVWCLVTTGSCVT